MNLTYLATAALAYLLGSIPFGYLLVRVFLQRDIRSVGSGNIGATNVARSGAKGLGLLTLLLDTLKGFAAVGGSALLFHLSVSHQTQTGAFASAYELNLAIAAVFAILGHVFPVWLRFRGGKGVATGLGVFLAIAPKAVLISVALFLLVFAVARIVSLASLVAAACFPLSACLLHPALPSALLLAMCFVSLLIIVKHHTNIRRLLRGTEPRFGSRKPALPDHLETQA